MGFRSQPKFSTPNPNNHHLVFFAKIKFLPGKRGALANSSAKMHPTDQISTAFVYSEAFKITSGALYHLVTTYLY